MELAWRRGAKLDWVWQPNDLHGRPRDWAVLYGLALNQVRLNFVPSPPGLIHGQKTGGEAFASGDSASNP